jgi:hypothetical protein
MDHMPLSPPSSELRASDAEREKVVAFLREHALAGRLDSDELEERIGLAYSARYVGQLERLIRDLPRRNAPAPSRPRACARKRKHEPTPALIVAGIALLFITGLPMVVFGVVLAFLAVVLGLSFVLGPFLLVALIIVATRRRRPPQMRYGRTV